MSSVGVYSSYSTGILATGKAKVWLLLVGVNEYQDQGLASLRYPAVDCQGLGEALNKATQGFPNKEVIIHHDFAQQPPTLAAIRASLQRIVSQSQSQDSILLYFSGHGMLEPNNQQAVLCMRDTQIDNLLGTGLNLQELMQILGTSSAKHQLVCLDTCHSGDMRLLGKGAGKARGGNTSETLVNPTPQMMDVLRQRAARSKGFCALLSCDQGQQSWEFPELGHGIFTYYLMQGLLGEAADSQGIIEADGLYKYVYRQTLQYIDKLNQQLRLINQQKLNRGDGRLYPEYPLQTPKRIVEGVGELVLGFKPSKVQSCKLRRALVIDGLSNNKTITDLGRVFGGAGGFEVEHLSPKSKTLSEIRGRIQQWIRWDSKSETKSLTQLGTLKGTQTSLLYLRGCVEEIEDGEAWLVLADGVRLSRSWLRQELRRSYKAQYIIILDCPEATSLDSWVEDLQCDTEYGQCLIAAASRTQEPELFSQMLLKTLVAANPRNGLSVATCIAQLQKLSQEKGIDLHVWLSDTQAVIDILPGNISVVFQQLQERQNTIQENNQEEDNEKSSKNIHNFPTTLQNPPQSSKTNPSVASPKPQSFQKAPAVSSTANSNSSTRVQLGPDLTIDSQQYTKLEQLLKQSIGSIAPTILQKALVKAENFEELVKILATYVAPRQQEQLKQQAMALLESSTVSPSNKPVKTAQTVDANFMSKCERELAYSVGPIASYMVRQVLKSHPQISPPELVKQLARQISDPILALEFEQRMYIKKA
ncbi:caspase domain-containing protein [Aetokthonos hydrillicola Thurmond2011]|jgi:uncharacterized caspase-like protein|uniref:Caspase domain-containing protein n=1 Tax=Aetokthonos hydrillicola Thurmond2011 TaxID=2712845 RepID=A0AAP5IAZ7_9CYAN|nr:caspase domain-containing protein [Aetokthonos hydrillicola]MBO3458232.1 peptidase C14 [Aetokthonos hydrillicola CCALA 1050]MBW4584451.1 caspase domain-containing protein [Aetokthonos hydrillicola CCALA 1050]MDR9896413.1 caspase domain-containing protein [Aetokthonos hydrillicola Thurmond2011]